MKRADAWGWIIAAYLILTILAAVGFGKWLDDGDD